jgi:membrane-bound lytic murein transglycosylase MltF
LAEATQRFGIPTAWVQAIMSVESGGDRHALSPKGAMGLMQLMPKTWAELSAQYGFGRDPFDPHDNIMAGVAYLREMLNRYGSPGFLAAYHAGPNRYEEYRDRHRPLPPETQAYVAELLPLVKGGEQGMSTLAVAVDAGTWSRAPLFIMRLASTERAGHVASGQTANNTPAAAVARDLNAIAPRSDGLFVTLSAGDKP